MGQALILRPILILLWPDVISTLTKGFNVLLPYNKARLKNLPIPLRIILSSYVHGFGLENATQV